MKGTTGSKVRKEGRLKAKTRGFNQRNENNPRRQVSTGVGTGVAMFGKRGTSEGFKPDLYRAEGIRPRTYKDDMPSAPSSDSMPGRGGVKGATDKMDERLKRMSAKHKSKD